MSIANWKDLYLQLKPEAVLKRLEVPFLYHTGRDELYEIDNNAANFLASCNGTKKGSELTDDSGFVEYCIDDRLLETLQKPGKRDIRVDKSPVPSLRYLELQLTEKCNLRCRHCYLGLPGKAEMSLNDAVKIAGDFSSMGGLKLLISGGEPLLYPALPEFLKEISVLNVRKVLITNGTLVSDKNILTLEVDEIQFSLDGMKAGHDMLRGEGNFLKTINGINLAADAGIDVSVATMIHKGNLNEFDHLNSLINEKGAIEWGIDVMCLHGSLEDNLEFQVPYDKAAPLLSHAFGGGYHGSSDGFSCGRHLMTVMPSGTAVKCGFYEDSPLGDAAEDLKGCWLNLEHIPLKKLKCRDCPVVNECCGGCRFRAPSILEPDPAMCAANNIDPESF